MWPRLSFVVSPNAVRTTSQSFDVLAHARTAHDGPRRKDRKRISAESSLMSPRRPNRSRDWSAILDTTLSGGREIMTGKRGNGNGGEKWRWMEHGLRVGFFHSTDGPGLVMTECQTDTIVRSLISLPVRSRLNTWRCFHFVPLKTTTMTHMDPSG